jgi:hypothetical protein
VAGSRGSLTPIGVDKFSNYLARTAREVAGPGLKDIHREVARMAADASRGEARGMGGLQAKAASAIRGAGNINAARVAVSATARTRYASVAYWGALRRSGWYAPKRYARSTYPQHAPWVGAHWRVGEKGEGPYAINTAIADNLDALQDLFRERLQELIDR